MNTENKTSEVSKEQKKFTIIPIENNKISIYELKKLCKQFGVKGYSKKKKSELVEMLLLNVDKSNDDVRRACYLSKTVKQLKAICKVLKIKGYSKERKIDLVNIINAKEKQNKELKEEIDKYFTDNSIQDTINMKSIINDAFVYQKCDPAATLSDLITFYTENEDKIKSVFVRTFNKKYRNKLKRNKEDGAVRQKSHEKEEYPSTPVLGPKKKTTH